MILRSIYKVFLPPLALLAACSADTVRVGDVHVPLKPSFADDIAPIVEAKCIGCHQTGSVAPIRFDTAADIAAYAPAIAASVANRTMPPYNVNNDGTCRTYKDARWLSEPEIATIANWRAAGGKIDDPVPLQAPSLASLSTANMTLVTPEFTPSIRPDHYRCFLLDPELTVDRYLSGVSVRPGAPEITHHMLLFNASGEALALAEQNSGADGRPGYDCFGFGIMQYFATGEMELVGTWAPGISSTPFPAGTGIRLPAGSKLIAQMHYNTIDKVLPDASSVDLAVVDSVDRIARSILLDDFDLIVPQGVTDATYAWTLGMDDILPRVYVRVPKNGYDILGVYPHMHERGVRQRLSYIEDDIETCLYDVDRWNFHWQEFFYYEDADVPRIFRRGDLKLECVYDTVGLDRPLEWGEGTQDEMCLTVLYVAEPVDN